MYSAVLVTVRKLSITPSEPLIVSTDTLILVSTEVEGEIAVIGAFDVVEPFCFSAAGDELAVDVTSLLDSVATAPVTAAMSGKKVEILIFAERKQV